MNGFESLHFGRVERNELAVLVNARWGDGLGENRRIAGHCVFVSERQYLEIRARQWKLTVVAKEDSTGSDIMLLRNLQYTLILEKRRSRASKRTVRRDMDALILAEINNFLLGQQWVVLDLVGSGHNGGLGEQLLHVFDRVVSYTNSLDLFRVSLNQLLKSFPGVDVGDATVEVAGAIFKLGEERVVAWRMRVTRSSRLGYIELYLPLGFIGTGQCIKYRST